MFPATEEKEEDTGYNGGSNNGDGDNDCGHTFIMASPPPLSVTLERSSQPDLPSLSQTLQRFFQSQEEEKVCFH
jgi:hypothetical protein